MLDKLLLVAAWDRLIAGHREREREFWLGLRGQRHMRQEISTTNVTDSAGMPNGGTVTGLGIDITWQAGPLGRGAERVPPNGAFVEGVIEAALQRLRWYQEASDGRFRCRENALAITKLEEALLWLDARTRSREARAVEGTHQP